jgi:hypothetical protein
MDSPLPSIAQRIFADEEEGKFSDFIRQIHFGRVRLFTCRSFKVSTMLVVLSQHQIDPGPPDFNPLNSFVGDFKR